MAGGEGRVREGSYPVLPTLKLVFSPLLLCSLTLSHVSLEIPGIFSLFERQSLVLGVSLPSAPVCSSLACHRGQEPR